MKAILSIFLIAVLAVTSIVGISVTVSKYMEQNSYSLNHSDDNYPKSDININNTLNNNDYYSGDEWSLTFVGN